MKIFQLTDLDISGFTFAMLGTTQVRYRQYFSTAEFAREYVTNRIGPVKWKMDNDRYYFRTKDTSYIIAPIELVK